MTYLTIGPTNDASDAHFGTFGRPRGSPVCELLVFFFFPINVLLRRPVLTNLLRNVFACKFSKELQEIILSHTPTVGVEKLLDVREGVDSAYDRFEVAHAKFTPDFQSRI